MDPTNPQNKEPDAGVPVQDAPQAAPAEPVVPVTKPEDSTPPADAANPGPSLNDITKPGAVVDEPAPEAPTAAPEPEQPAAPATGSDMPSMADAPADPAADPASPPAPEEPVQPPMPNADSGVVAPDAQVQGAAMAGEAPAPKSGSKAMVWLIILLVLLAGGAVYFLFFA